MSQWSVFTRPFTFLIVTVHVDKIIVRRYESLLIEKKLNVCSIRKTYVTRSSSPSPHPLSSSWLGALTCLPLSLSSYLAFSTVISMCVCECVIDCHVTNETVIYVICAVSFRKLKLNKANSGFKWWGFALKCSRRSSVHTLFLPTSSRFLLFIDRHRVGRQRTYVPKLRWRDGPHGRDSWHAEVE